MAAARSGLAAALVVLLLAGFVAGLVRLVQLRFTGGDVYAPYSTLRTEPVGSAALHGALERVGLAVARHHRPLAKLPGGSGRTVLVLGVPAQALVWGSELEAALRALAEAGSRVILAARPPGKLTRLDLSLREEDEAPEPATPPAGADETGADETGADETGNGPEPVPPEEAAAAAAAPPPSPLGLAFAWETAGRAEGWSFGGERTPGAEPALPAMLTVHTPLVLRAREEGWRVIYARDGGAVVAERSFGAGSVVVFADAFPFSNEGLQAELPAELLSWALGPAREVVFHEAHLGLYENVGVMTLVHRYRLGGLLAALFLVAGLAVWRNAVPLVPPPPPRAGGEAARDHFAGLVQLLRRHVPPADLAGACWREWRRSLPRRGPPSAEKREQVQQLVRAELQRPPRERRPLALYRAVWSVLKEKALPRRHEGTKAP